MPARSRRERRWFPSSRAATTIIAVVLSAGFAALPATAAIFGQASPTPAPSRYIVGRMGIEMKASEARHSVVFRPFSPPRRVVDVALLPPFHGDDERANRGIGIEYSDDDDRLYALAQWPANGRAIDQFEPLASPDIRCPGARSFTRGTTPNGIVWTTPHGLIMTLQPDGKTDARTLHAEWSKLIRRGVCR